MKHVELEESSLLSSTLPNDNPLQSVFCAREIHNFQLCEQSDYHRYNLIGGVLIIGYWRYIGRQNYIPDTG